MVKKERTPFEKLKRKYNTIKRLFLVSLILLGVTVYQSYNYWVFKVLIAGNYIDTDTLDVLYAETLGEENFNPETTTGYVKDFDKVVMAVVTGAIRAKNNDRYTLLYTPEAYAYSKEYEKKDAELSTISILSEDTVSINLPNISKGTRDFFLQNKKELNAYKNIIIDLRHNYGGLLADYYDMAELFLPRDDTIGYEITRLPILTHEVKSKKAPYFQFERIIILQDEDTASSAEGFIMALKENLDNVTLVGTQTFGKGIGQVTVPLTGGYAVKGTVLALETPKKQSIHGVGIAPDVNYEKEDILAYALGLLEP